VLEDDGPKLSADDIALLQHLYTTLVRGAESAAEKRTAEKLIDQGLIDKDPDGFFQLTLAGKKILIDLEASRRWLR